MEIESTSIFTAQDADQFLQEYPEKNETLEAFLLKNGFSSLIHNIKTESLALTQGNQTLFATLNNKEYDNAHICSPYNIYIGYAKVSAKSFNNFWVRALIYSFTTLFGGLFKRLNLNKVIQLNNTLLTINIHPQEVSKFLPGIIQTLTQKYPTHAILWPRVNSSIDKDLYKELERNNFHLVPTKIVHIYDLNENYMKRSHTKRDLSLLKKSDYQIVRHDELAESDMVRIHELYQMLFIEKHVGYNPNLSLYYFKLCHQFRWFEFHALRNSDGIIDAFIAQVKKDNTMVCGPLGYDTEKPIKLGLYRMIIGLSLENAYSENCLYNLGSGNELFKLNRGSKREMEYNAVYYQHLPFYRRIPWKILAYAGQQFSRRIFKKHFL